MKNNNSINYRLRHERAVVSDFRRGIDKQNQEWLDGTLEVYNKGKVRIKGIDFYKDLSKKKLYEDSDLKEAIKVKNEEYDEIFLDIFGE